MPHQSLASDPFLSGVGGADSEIKALSAADPSNCDTMRQHAACQRLSLAISVAYLDSLRRRLGISHIPVREMPQGEWAARAHRYPVRGSRGVPSATERRDPQGRRAEISSIRRVLPEGLFTLFPRLSERDGQLARWPSGYQDLRQRSGARATGKWSLGGDRSPVALPTAVAGRVGGRAEGDVGAANGHRVLTGRQRANQRCRGPAGAIRLICDVL